MRQLLPQSQKCNSILQGIAAACQGASSGPGIQLSKIQSKWSLRDSWSRCQHRHCACRSCFRSSSISRVNPATLSINSSAWLETPTQTIHVQGSSSHNSLSNACASLAACSSFSCRAFAMVGTMLRSSTLNTHLYDTPSQITSTCSIRLGTGIFEAVRTRRLEVPNVILQMPQHEA